MDTSFGDWYRQANLKPEDPWLRLRWQGVVTAAQQPRRGTIADMARLFHGRQAKTDYESHFRLAFHNADTAFQMNGNDFELSLLAGATLLQVIATSSDELAVGAAFAMICPTLQGQFGQKSFPEMLASARTYLQNRRSKLRREVPPPFDGHPVSLNDETLKPLVDACNTNQLPAIGTQLSGILKSVGQYLNDLTSSVRLIESYQLLYREESDALWWLTGRSSRDLSLPFSQIEQAAACLVAGKELADMTRVLPGPLAAPAILHALLCQESDNNPEVTLSKAVNTSDREWRKHCVAPFASSTSLDLCPVLFALNESTRSEQVSAWHPVLKLQTGVANNARLPILSFAEQVYDECLLLRSLNGLEE